MKTNATSHELQQALELTNRNFNDNVKFKRIEQTGSRVTFTLTVKSSKDKGGRLSHTGRRIAAACWHVHGEFFDNLLAIQPEAWIKTGQKKIDANGGNWEDWNIGSNYQPMYYSQACEC